MKVIMTKILRVFSGLREEFRHLKINLNGQESWRITKCGSNSVFFFILDHGFL